MAQLRAQRSRHSASFWILVPGILLAALGGCKTAKGVTWPAFGTYRLPYADGTTVNVINDFATHSPVGRYDLKGQGGGPYSIVAAADGWIRFIEDGNSGHTTGDNNYVWIEHPYPFCQSAGVTWPGKPANYDATCVPCQGDFCNEWTKSSHMATGSTTGDAGLSVGDFVTAGTFLGYESDIGHASGPHLHWEVAKLDPDHPLSDADNGWSYDWSSDGWLGSPNLLPNLCGVGTLLDGDSHTAAPCGPSAAPRPGLSRLDWTSLWTTGADGAAPVSTVVKVVLSEPDAGGRVTLESVALAAPATLVVARDGALPFPVGTRVDVRSLDLVRPVTFGLPPGGIGELSGREILVQAELVVTVPGRAPFRTRLGAPLSGKLYVATRGSYFLLALDGGLAGRLRGTGIFLSR